MALDTLAIQRRLRDAGLNDQLADAITREIADSITDEIANKPDLSDLQEVRNELKADIIQVREAVARLESRMAELANEIAELRNTLSDYKVGSSRWTLATVVAIAVGFAGVIVALALA